MKGRHFASGTPLVATASETRRFQANAVSLEEIAKRTAGPTRGQKKTLTQAAMLDMREAADTTVVLPHIHPRWLRRDVEALLDAGQYVTGDDIERMRKEGQR